MKPGIKVHEEAECGQIYSSAANLHSLVRSGPDTPYGRWFAEAFFRILLYVMLLLLCIDANSL